MTSRYMCRAYHVSDVSTQPGIVQTLHPHAMMSSGARDMLCYLSALAVLCTAHIAASHVTPVLLYKERSAVPPLSSLTARLAL